MTLDIKDINPDLLQRVIDKILEVAEKDACSDDEDFNANDYCGGNYDDAFEKGTEDGEIIFARQLRDML